LVLALVVLQGSCGEPAEDAGSAEPSTRGSAPLLGVAALWPGGVVPVCWETGLASDGSGQPVNPHTRADWPTLSAFVRDTMRSTWGRVANVNFVYFGDCPATTASGNAGYVAINMGGGVNMTCGNTTPGYNPNGWTRMRLDTGCTFGNPDTWGEFRGQVMHETGHALGFQHEFDRARPDSTRNSGCVVADGNHLNNTGPTYGTAFDIPSIMNYSYDQGAPSCALPRPFRLSGWDIVGVQNAYGRRMPGTLLPASGDCLDLPLPYSSGESLQVYACQRSSNQVWQLSPGGAIWSPSYVSFVDVPWSLTSPGVWLDGNVPNTPQTLNQTWRPLSGYQVRGVGDTCLDVPYGNIADNQYVQIFSCNGGLNQRWRAYTDGTIRPMGNQSFCLDVPYGSAYAGNLLQLYHCNGGASQRFAFQDSGEIRFQNLCLDVVSGTPSSGNNVQLYPCKSAGDQSRANQLWHLTMSINAFSGLCIEAQGGSSLDHTPIIQNTCNGNSSGQEWDYYFRSFVGF
jgi:hypothetical protein